MYVAALWCYSMDGGWKRAQIQRQFCGVAFLHFCLSYHNVLLHFLRELIILLVVKPRFVLSQALLSFLAIEKGQYSKSLCLPGQPSLPRSLHAAHP